MAVAQVEPRVQVKPQVKPQRTKKPQIISYEIPNSFNPFEMGERIIRVEDELRHQRELMQQGFAMMDKRFEYMQRNMDKRFEAVDKRFEDIQRNMDKRFEDMDKRFKMMMWVMGGGFTAVIGMLTVLINKTI